MNHKNTEGVKKKLPEIAVMLIAALVFFYKFGWQVLDVTNIGWLFTIGFDNPTEFISWEYYRWSPWSFPVIGTMSGYDYPTVTGVGLTGAIPLLAIPIKVFSDYLPQNFQHFGWWFLMCYVLQGLFGYKFLKSVTPQYFIKNQALYNVFLILGSVFFIMAPPFVFRATHMNLSAHFLILASLFIYFEPFTSDKKTKYQLLLVFFAAAIHQYLTVMLLGLAFAQTNDLWQRKQISFWKLMRLNLTNLAVALFVFYIVGNFNIPNAATQSIGFGTYSANLNTFFNSFNYGKILPALKTSSEGQYEGFAYFGVGILLILIVLVINYLVLKTKERLRGKTEILEQSNTFSENSKPLMFPILSIAIVFFIYALSNVIGLNGTVLHTYAPGPLFKQLGDSLRGSGRFVWTLYYFIMAFSIVGLMKIKTPNLLKISLLVALTGIQIYDVKPMLLMHDVNTNPYKGNINWEKWQPVFREAKRVITYSPYYWNYQHYGDFYDFSHLAALEKKAITTGYFARSFWGAKKDWEKNYTENLDRGVLGDDSASVVVCRIDDVGRFDKVVDNGTMKAFRYENYPIFVPITLPKTIEYLSQLPDCQSFNFDTEGLTHFLKRHADKLLLVTANDDASYRLCQDAKDYFGSMGSVNIQQLSLYGSYMGVFYKNKLLFEKVDNGAAVKEVFDKGKILRGYTFKKTIDMLSAGGYWGRTCSTKIEGKEAANQKTGLNIVVLNENYEVVESVDFNTYSTCERVILK
jgi:Family of unknown function (DUF6311)/Interleukin-like EMT inducer